MAILLAHGRADRRHHLAGRRKEDMDPQLITAIAGLLTAAATLIKVLQHDGIIKQTSATVTRTAAQSDSAIAELSTHMQALAEAAATFAAAAKQQPPPSARS